MVAGEVVDSMRAGFSAYVRLARDLVTPNPDDTLDIRCAIVGFSLHTQTENWTHDHFQFVRSRLDEAPDLYTDEVRLLQALCLGAICGLAFERRLTEQEFQLADLQLPGYLLALPHGEPIEYQPDAAEGG
jgi:catechol 2,3-dioxygenase-like lactoylglutathione lyase family enzyme